MTARQLYATPAKQTTHELEILAGHLYNHLPEAGDPASWAFLISTEVEIRTLGYRNFDGSRIWHLATVWFQGKPVMVIQNAGRDGDDHVRRYVTDTRGLRMLAGHVKALAFLEVLENDDMRVIEEDEEASELSHFYGEDLHSIKQ